MLELKREIAKHERHLHGLCTDCGQPTKTGRLRCEKHLARAIAASRRQYTRQRARGLCGSGACKVLAAEGHSQCEYHLRVNTERIVTMHRTRTAQGLCRYCGIEPKWFGVFCFYCYALRKNHPHGRRDGAHALPMRVRKLVRWFWRMEAINERRVYVESVLSKITNLRTREMIALRHGIVDGTDHTLKEIGAMFGLTRERVRQIEMRALIDLAHLGVDITPLAYPFKEMQRTKGGRKRGRRTAA